MNTETVLARILPGIEEVIKAMVSLVDESSAPATLYDLEEQTQAVLPRIGQVVVQELVRAQGAGIVGPTRSCPCGAEQHYHDQARRLSVQTSVGLIQLAHRAAYRPGVSFLRTKSNVPDNYCYLADVSPGTPVHSCAGQSEQLKQAGVTKDPYLLVIW